MKWNRNIIGFLLISLITGWFTVFCLLEGRNLKKQFETVGIRFTEEGITAKNIDNAIKREESTSLNMPPEITAWKSVQGIVIKNKYLNRVQTVTALLIKGDMSAVISMGLVSGSFVYPGDSRGCLIDEKTAYTLFGTRSAVHNTLDYKDKQYSIRGIVKTSIPVIMLQEDSPSEKYPCLEVRYKNMENGQDNARVFLSKNGIIDNYILIDEYFYGRLLYGLAVVPVQAFYIIVAGLFLKGVIAEKKRQAGYRLYVYIVIMLFLIIAGFVLLYQIIGNPVYISGKYIPSKWSDFDFWVTKHKEFKAELLQLRYLNPNIKDVLLYDKFKAYCQIPVKTGMLYLMLYLFRNRVNYSKSVK